MTIPPSGQTTQPQSPNRQTPGRVRGPTVLSAICGVIALVAAALWLLAMEIVAGILRPPELSAFPAYRGDVRPFQEAALTRMTVIVIASFLAILAVAALAILLGRRARRLSSNEAPLARLEKWAVVCLLVSLLGLGSILLLLGLGSMLASGSFFARLPSFIARWLSMVVNQSRLGAQWLVALTATGAMGCLILSSIAVRFARGQAIHRWRTRISLVVSALILLAWFVITVFVARFIVGFYLHLVG